jgi:hypothetical protein
VDISVSFRFARGEAPTPVRLSRSTGVEWRTVRTSNVGGASIWACGPRTLGRSAAEMVGRPDAMSHAHVLPPHFSDSVPSESLRALRTGAFGSWVARRLYWVATTSSRIPHKMVDLVRCRMVRMRLGRSE